MGEPESKDPTDSKQIDPGNDSKKRDADTKKLFSSFFETGDGLFYESYARDNIYQQKTELVRKANTEKDPEKARILRLKIETLDQKLSVGANKMAAKVAGAISKAVQALTPPCSPSLSPSVGMIVLTSTYRTQIGGLPMRESIVPWPKFVKKLSDKVARVTKLAKAAHRFEGWARGRLENHRPPSLATTVGDPVDVATGRVLVNFVVCTLPGTTPFELRARYSSAWGHRQSSLGFGWSHNLEVSAWLEPGRVVVRDEEGCELEFPLPAGVRSAHDLSPGTRIFQPFYRRTLIRGRDNTWELCGAPGHRLFLARCPHSPDRWQLATVSLYGHTFYRIRRGPGGRMLGAVFAGGRTISFHYNAAGQLSRIDLPAPDGLGQQLHMKFSYAAQALSEACGLSGYTHKFSYEGSLLVAHTVPAGITYRYRYDGDTPEARCVHTSGDDGRHARALDYTEDGRTTCVRDGEGNITTYHHNELGAVTCVVDCQGGTRRVTYNDHLWPTHITDAHGHTHHYEYDEGGRVVRHTAPNGAQTSVTRDCDGHITSATDPNGGTWTWTRNRTGQVIREENPTGETTVLDYDAACVTGVVFSPGQEFVYSYHASGTLTGMRSPDGAWHRWSYNHLGGVIGIHDPGGRTCALGLDPLGRTVAVRNFDDTNHRYAWTPWGALAGYTSSSTTFALTHNPAGDLVQLEGNHYRSTRSFDCEGRLVSITDTAGHTHQFERDRLGQIVRETTRGGETREFRRNLLGQVFQIDFETGDTLELAYDYAGHLTAVTGANGLALRYGYDLAGNIVSAKNQQACVTLDRDPLGRVTQERNDTGFVRQTLDRVGNPLVIQTSRALTQRHSYTDRGRLAATTFEQAGPRLGLWALHDQHTVCGRLIRRQLVSDTSQPNRVVHCSYHRTGELARIEVESDHSQPGQQVTRVGFGNFQWTDGRHISTARSPDDVATVTEVRYGHAHGGRLVEAVTDHFGTFRRYLDSDGRFHQTPPESSEATHLPGGACTKSGSRRMSYDKFGRRTQQTDGEQKHVYQYDRLGHLTRVEGADGTEVSFAYDAFGRLVSRTSQNATTRWMWHGDQLIHESRESSTAEGPEPEATVSWIFARQHSLPVARLQTGAEPQAHAVIAGPGGMPHALLTDLGEQAWAGWIDPQLCMHTNIGCRSRMPWRGPDGLYEEATGLVYIHSGFYDPVSGHNLTPDPHGPWASDYEPADPWICPEFPVEPDPSEPCPLPHLPIPLDEPIPLPFPPPPRGLMLPPTATKLERRALVLARDGINPAAIFEYLQPRVDFG